MKRLNKQIAAYTQQLRLGEIQMAYKVVSFLISKDEYYANQSIRFVEDTFGGSLPKFLTSFISGKKLSNHQAEELKRLIDEHKEV